MQITKRHKLKQSKLEEETGKQKLNVLAEGVTTLTPSPKLNKTNNNWIFIQEGNKKY
jgi:hypothetical protein